MDAQVIDEADEMLNRNFKEQLYDIYRYLPPKTQVYLEGRIAHILITSYISICHSASNNTLS